MFTPMQTSSTRAVQYLLGYKLAR